ncbi:MAG: hypothetical protein VX195_07185 [Pseudomonadota bacterium]|nr:hypothetical protein [Pseudomonadota bacterium]
MKVVPHRRQRWALNSLANFGPSRVTAPDPIKAFWDMHCHTKHRKFKVWHLDSTGNLLRIDIVPRREIWLGTASDYVVDRGGKREWKCDEGIRAAMWNETAYLNRMSNVLNPVVESMPQHIEDDCVMLLLDTWVPRGWADQVVPFLLASRRIDAMTKLSIAGMLGDQTQQSAT